jgi:transcription elongation factor Elf1
VNYRQAITQSHQRVRNLQLQRAETPVDRQEIFKNRQELEKFVRDTLYDSEVLKDFELHCREDRLPYTSTLSNVIGPLNKYEAENEDMCGWPDLPSYVEEQLDIYLTREQHRKLQEQLQKEAPDFLLNFKCSFCGAKYESMFIDSSGGEIVCKCKKSFSLVCPGCKGKFDFDADKAVFYCRKCNLFFEIPALTYSDFIFREEPAELPE